MTERLPENLIRLFCDGELPEHEAAEVRRHLAANPAERDRVEFERRMRQRIGALMQAAAPAELAEQVRRAVAQSAHDPQASNAGQTQARAQTRSAAETARQAGRSRWDIANWFAGPQQVNVFAVAACLALVGGVVLVGIFGPTIDQVPRRANPDDLVGARILSEAAQFATREHGQTARNTDAAKSRLKYDSLEMACATLRDHLGVSVPGEIDVSNLGYEFVCGGPCELPPRSYPSGHLLFRQPGKETLRPCVSVFFEPEYGQYVYDDGQTLQRLAPGVVYSFPSGCSKGLVMSDGQMVYLVTACRSDELPRLEMLLKHVALARDDRGGFGR